jgi:hypothetical protein
VQEGYPIILLEFGNQDKLGALRHKCPKPETPKSRGRSTLQIWKKELDRWIKQKRRLYFHDFDYREKWDVSLHKLSKFKVSKRKSRSGGVR